jgi:hypothetical protein
MQLVLKIRIEEKITLSKVSMRSKADTTLSCHQLFIAEYFNQVECYKGDAIYYRTIQLIDSQGCICFQKTFHLIIVIKMQSQWLNAHHDDNFGTSPDLAMGGNCTLKKDNEEQESCCDCCKGCSNFF